MWTSYLRLQEPFCATPEISHIFPHEWDFPVGGAPNPSSHPKQIEYPDGNKDPRFDSFPGALDSDSFPLNATELACTEKNPACSFHVKFLS